MYVVTPASLDAKQIHRFENQSILKQMGRKKTFHRIPMERDKNLEIGETETWINPNFIIRDFLVILGHLLAFSFLGFLTSLRSLSISLSD